MKANEAVKDGAGKVVLSEEEWRKKLTPEQYEICREKGTERPNTGKYLHHKEKGTYACVACGHPIFSSETKYDSGCGWPAYYDALADGAKLNTDTSFGFTRVEAVCARCDSHLGHVFDDGPPPTGKRY